jgi:hypothetical protein
MLGLEARVLDGDCAGVMGSVMAGILSVGQPTSCGDDCNNDEITMLKTL